jgi:hypothetical protein
MNIDILRILVILTHKGLNDYVKQCLAKPAERIGHIAPLMMILRESKGVRHG